MKADGSSSCLHTHIPNRYASLRGGKTLPSMVARVEGTASAMMPAVKSSRTTSDSGAGCSIAGSMEQAPNISKQSKRVPTPPARLLLVFDGTIFINQPILSVSIPRTSRESCNRKGNIQPRPVFFRRVRDPQSFDYWMVPEVSPASTQSVMVADGTICVPMKVNVTRWLTPAPPAVMSGFELVRVTDVL